MMRVPSDAVSRKAEWPSHLIFKCGTALQRAGLARPEPRPILPWLLLRRDDRDAALAAADPVELHDAVGQGEQGVVLGAADVGTGHHSGTTLTHDDAAGRDPLRTECL